MKLIFLGDIFLPSKVSLNVSEEIVKILYSGTVIGNLEGPICSRGRVMEKYSVLRMEPAAALELRRLNIGAVSLANNHVMDYDVEGLLETLDNLKKANIKWFGAGLNVSDALTPLIISVNNLKVGLLGLTTVFVQQARASEVRAGVAGIRLKTQVILNPLEVLEEPGAPYIVGAEVFRDDLKKVEDVVRDFRKSVDVLISYVHWGVGTLPYSTVILEYQRELGRFLIDLGVDLVIGTHPHILLPIEKYRGKFIAYSLGNFIFAEQVPLPISNVGGMLILELGGGIREINVLTLVPVCLDESGIPTLCSNLAEVPEVAMFISNSRKLGCRCAVSGNQIMIG